MPAQTLTKRQIRHEQTKIKIVRTAMEVIAERGLDKLSMRELARRCGVSAPSLYEYFHGKEELMEGIAEEVNSRLMAYFIAVPAGLKPKESILHQGLAYLRFARENPDYFLMVFAKLSQEGECYMRMDDDGPYTLLIHEVIRALEAGEFTNPNGFAPEEIAYVLWSSVHGMSMLRLTILKDEPGDWDSLHEKALSQMLEAF